MPARQQQDRPTDSTQKRTIPVTSWIGIVGTAILALAGLASGGVWSMVTMITIVVLITAVYGVLFRRTTWLRLPRKRAAAALGAGIALVVMIGSTSAYGATHPLPSQPVQRVAAVADAPAHTHRTSSPTRNPHPQPDPHSGRHDRTRQRDRADPVHVDDGRERHDGQRHVLGDHRRRGRCGDEDLHGDVHRRCRDWTDPFQSGRHDAAGHAGDHRRHVRRSATSCGTSCTDLHERHLREQRWCHGLPARGRLECSEWRDGEVRGRDLQLQSVAARYVLVPRRRGGVALS